MLSSKLIELYITYSHEVRAEAIGLRMIGDIEVRFPWMCQRLTVRSETDKVCGKVAPETSPQCISDLSMLVGLLRTTLIIAAESVGGIVKVDES